MPLHQTVFTEPSGHLIRDAEDSIATKGALPISSLAQWETERQADPTARLAQTVLSRMPMSKVLLGRAAELETPMSELAECRDRLFGLAADGLHHQRQSSTIEWT